jgi:hypothetical protein
MAVRVDGDEIETLEAVTRKLRRQKFLRPSDSTADFIVEHRGVAPQRTRDLGRHVLAQGSAAGIA